jgi:hypothetical protein
MSAIAFAEGLSCNWRIPMFQREAHWASLAPEPRSGSLGQSLISKLSDAGTRVGVLPFECTTTLIQSGHTILDTMFGSP